jgi:hypothetical protein
MKKIAVKAGISIALILVSLGISMSSSSLRYDNIKDNGRLQEQLTGKISQVSGVWVSVKIASGVISFLQTIQVEGSIPVVGGLAVAVEPMGWTEVVDNTLDQISNICLWAMAALAIQKVLLAVSLWVSLRIIVPVCAFLIILAIWNKKHSGQLIRVIAGIAIVSLGICIAIPLSLELSNLVETSILAGQIEETVNEINGISQEIEENSDEANDMSSPLATLRRIGNSIANFFGNIKNLFDSLIDRAVNYIILFIVTNILIPIGTLFGLKYFISAALSFIGVGRRQ